MLTGLSRRSAFRGSCALLAAALVFAASDGESSRMFAQPATPNGTQPQASTQMKLNAMRDRFTSRVKAAGFTCALPSPAVLIEEAPAFGEYQDASNHLRTPDWAMLAPEERAYFVKRAGPETDEAGVRALFEQDVHQWIFALGLAHWWQNCRGVDEGRPPYEVEYAANRIALAFWREQDSAFAASMDGFFHLYLANTPAPVPVGQPIAGYFSAHFGELKPSAAYPWFEAYLFAATSDETPLPSFKRALAETK